MGFQTKLLDWVAITTLMAETREIEEPLDEGEKGKSKSWFKTQH